MTLLWILILPFALAWLPPWLASLGARKDGLPSQAARRASALGAALPTAIAFVLLVLAAPDILAGQPVEYRLAWIPSLGLDIALRLDGLGLLYGLLITGIGLCVILYAHTYLSAHDPPGRFFAYLLLFMGALLGVALSDNLIFLLIVWEVTSVASFLLIGYWSDEHDARRGARVALGITGAGGLALLAGAVLITDITQTSIISEIIARADLLQADPRFSYALVLILIGAFTKSAQVPFHIWLPGAMAAPTPVSAYLHSATMVKAGVFLLARLHPALAGGDLWFGLVTGFGMATLFFGAYHAFFQHDLKSVLAYSTISHLGLITALLGFDTPLASVAAVFHFLNHALFKASLFMCAGIIDHQTGTRDLHALGGLRRAMPVTFVLTVLASASMAGLPLLNGFVSKEMFFTESLTLTHLGELGWLIPTLTTVAALWGVAYSLRLVFSTFFGDRGDTLPIPDPVDPPWLMRLPAMLLVALCLLIGVDPTLVEGLIDSAGASVIGGPPPDAHLALWHGFSTAVIMSVSAIGLGIAWYLGRDRVKHLHEKVVGPLIEAPQRRAIDRVTAFLVGLTRAITTRIEGGHLQTYLSWILALTAVVMAVPFFDTPYTVGPRAHTPIDVLGVATVALILTGTVATLRFRDRRLVALMCLSLVGLGVVLTFARYSAPDLALTQITVEIVTVVLLVLALWRLPHRSPPEGRGTAHRTRDIALSVVIGAGVALIAYAMMTRDGQPISDFYLENSVALGGGANVVNVILVDFRGFDTFGELTVLGMTGVGAFILLRGLRLPPTADHEVRASSAHSIILRTLSRPMLPLTLLMAAHIFLRGHDLPGGGFIAALVISIAFILQYIANGTSWTDRRLTFNFRRLVAIGILLAATTGLASLIAGSPFLTAIHADVELPLIGKIHLITTIAFDLGVLLAVVGAVMQQIAGLGAISRPPESSWKP